MKFLKINAKVLLILCLFSGILFLSTGCDDKEIEDDDTQEVDKKTDDKKDNDSNNTSSTDTKETDNNSSSTVKETNNDNTAINDTVDYTVWIANTTINTDKNQKSYKVIWGDTLWLISTAWEVPYQEIATYNNIPNPDLIYVDQIIYNPLFK